MTPPKQKGEVVDTAPALQFSAHKMPDEKWNADIYTVSSTGPLLTGHLELLIKVTKTKHWCASEWVMVG